MVVDTSIDEVAEVVEKKKFDKLITAKPKKVKKSLMNRLISGIMGPDGLPGIGEYVNEEIIKPAVKNLIYDAITSAASRAMFGRTGGPTRHNSGYNNYGSRSVNYNNRYNNASSNQPAPKQQQEDRRVRSTRYGVDEFLIEDRYDAAHILTTLTESADKYNVVSVADYYDLIGAPSQYTDNNYGWTFDSISTASIIPVRGGYIIKFPAVEVI